MQGISSNETGIRWIVDPIMDIIGQSFGLEDTCQVQCGTLTCKILCSGGYCYKHSDATR
jgi:hypothetical protein